MQFVFMLGGALVVLPMAMAKVGGWPSLVQQVPEQAVTLVAQSGTYNWKFIAAIFLLGIEWACVDQGLLQRAFGAESTKTVARGLVLAGIITTPFALLWNLPGLAARVLHPGLANADSAIPTLLANLLPNIVLGFVVCGLIASHLSTISANLNGVATIVASDLYESTLNRKATDADILRVARAVTVATGAAMIGFAYLVPKLGGAVEAYLTIVAIMDMPLFIIAVIFGLLWKRANAVGAIVGYAAGAIAGVVGTFVLKYDFNLTTFISAGVTLMVTPVVSLTTRSTHSIDSIWRAKQSSDEEERSGERYDIIPRSMKGRMSLAVLFGGLLVFFVGVFLGSAASPFASVTAVAGMVLFFAGGLWRAFVD
jgi:SSS family solute:Na+ symporter